MAVIAAEEQTDYEEFEKQLQEHQQQNELIEGQNKERGEVMQGTSDQESTNCCHSALFLEILFLAIIAGAAMADFMTRTPSLLYLRGTEEGKRVTSLMEEIVEQAKESQDCFSRFSLVTTAPSIPTERTPNLTTIEQTLESAQEPSLEPSGIIRLIQNDFPVTVSATDSCCSDPSTTIDGFTDPYADSTDFWTTPYTYRHHWMVDLKAGWGRNVVVTKLTLHNA